MELITLVITAILAAVLAVAGVTATLMVMLRDGYRARPFQSSYDSRQPN
ncbi:hypothetical protein [Pseudoclavibacter sp. AY1F1]|nr:hypothetical protein [Pseudoclavibacter sp. AY1F1]